LCSESDGDLVKVPKTRFLARPQESQFAFVLGGEEVEDVVDVDPHFGRLTVDDVDVDRRQAVWGQVQVLFVLLQRKRVHGNQDEI